MSYRCDKCGNLEINDGFVTIELGKCKKAYNELHDKYRQAIAGLTCIAQGTACVCESGCPKCDATEILSDLGYKVYE